MLHYIIDYKYESGNNCYIFNTVVHIYLHYRGVGLVISKLHVVQINPAFCLKERRTGFRRRWDVPVLKALFCLWG